MKKKKQKSTPKLGENIIKDNELGLIIQINKEIVWAKFNSISIHIPYFIQDLIKERHGVWKRKT